MRPHNPPHPGETVRDDVLPALGVTEPARAMGANRAAQSPPLRRQIARIKSAVQ